MEEHEKMTEQQNLLTRHDLEAKIVRRCWEDEEFCKEFTADPAAVFVKYLQIPSKNLPKISVYREEPGSWHIVLPAKPANSGQLSEAELEKVAGGVTPALVVSASTLTVVGTAAASAIVTAQYDEKIGW
jgi:hypothetical protein